MNAVEMVKAALAEAGYPDVWVKEVRVEGVGRTIRLCPSTPMPVAWRVGALMTPATMCCYPCYVLAGGHGSKAACSHSLWDGAPPVVRP